MASSDPIADPIPATLWVCRACGKRSRDRHGKRPIDFGWDISCFLYAVEARADHLVIEGGRVVRILDGGEVSEPL